MTWMFFYATYIHFYSLITLPDYFLSLSVMQAYIEKEDSKKLKQKQRERMQPKMGKMDIDYQVSFVFYKI